MNSKKTNETELKQEKINKDHREIGKNLNIFGFDELIGSGAPYWLENGFFLKKTISEYVNKIQQKRGITMVSTPDIGRKELYEISGHWDHYKENIFPPIKLEDSDNKNEYILRPMTCPHHILLYKKQILHEKHLPIAFGENAKLYRYESSGGLFGLERTRCMELIDTHIFCSTENLFDSLQKALDIILEIKQKFNIEYDSTILSLRSKEKEKFYNDDSLWEKAEGILKKFMTNNKISYKEGIGDAAFYGPKIDFQIKTFMGKIITISTIQLDFLLPQKFQINYLCGENGEKRTPILIHLGIIGTLERFVAYLLERNLGWLPFWLSPTQITVIPINIKFLEHCQKLKDLLEKQKEDIRIKIDIGSESLGKKISKAVQQKSYGYIVVGEKESEEIKKIDVNNFEILEILKKISITRNKENNLKLSEISEVLDYFSIPN